MYFASCLRNLEKVFEKLFLNLIYFLGSLLLTFLLALECVLFIKYPIVKRARFLFKKTEQNTSF